MIQALIIWYHILSHGAICFFDYTQSIPLLDFVTRPDGSASDPTNLTPLETIYAAVTAMSFGTVGAAYALALADWLPVRGAAAISVFFHALWLIHMVWRWEVWRAMMHPQGTLTPEFFLIGHVVWTVLSLYLVVVAAAPSTREKKQKAK